LNKKEQNINHVSNKVGTVSTIQVPKIISEGKNINEIMAKSNSSMKNETFVEKLQLENPKVVVYERPNPWSKIIIDKIQEYPYLFHIQVKIPSLNDLENWRQIVPNIEFDPKTGELIIPSKDEESALALANLMIINFTGQISLKDIIDKNLIQISVSKAKYGVVQNKLREQIMENLFGKQFNASQTSFEKDLAIKSEPFGNVSNQQNLQNQNSSGRIDFTSETFTDTFEHFSEKNNIGEEGVEAWDGDEFSYL
jgi:hypothetical protein